MFVNYGGSQISCSDSSNSSLVIFFRGCPYKCSYCHNKELQNGENYVTSRYIMKQILDNQLISEVILSGGEAMFQPKSVEELAQFCHLIGLKVGLETSGYNSEDLELLIREELIDEIFLDVKTYGEENYFKLTGHKDSWKNIKNIISMCMWYSIPLQIRTTIFPDYPDKDSLNGIENMVKNYGLNWKKQEGR